jgi:predicted metal-dependent enzyme (double-stranded beta helix superfamily)
MDSYEYTLDRLVTELREASALASSQSEIIGRVQAIAQRAAARQAEWLRDDMCEPDAEQGFGFRLLHEEAGHDLAVFIASWLPGRGTPPHDHGTWAVVVGLKGRERNTRWRRLDDGARAGYAQIAPAGERLVGAGDVVAMLSGAIHSVCNDGDGVSVSLHIYGRHVNHTHRSQFDPERQREAPYKVATSGRSLAAASTPSTEVDHDR